MTGLEIDHEHELFYYELGVGNVILAQSYLPESFDQPRLHITPRPDGIMRTAVGEYVSAGQVMPFSQELTEIDGKPAGLPPKGTALLVFMHQNGLDNLISELLALKASAYGTVDDIDPEGKEMYRLCHRALDLYNSPDQKDLWKAYREHNELD